jgi:pimeloyl-ACP methyl ester carboxylesterase
MVGASIGGLYVRSYAAEYPQEIAGLVLVDGTFEAELDTIKIAPSTIFVVMGKLGIFRLLPEMICPGTACDATSKPMIAAFRGRATLYQTVDGEWAGLKAPDSLATLRKRLSPAGSLGATPLVILSANQSGLPENQMESGYRETIARYRAAMTSLSSNHRYILVNGGHGLANEHPKLVIESVKAAIEAARSGKPLAP